MDMICTAHYESPLGGITMASDGTALTGLWFDGQRYFGGDQCIRPHSGQEGPAEAGSELPVFGEARRWLDVYFSGRSPGQTPLLRPETTEYRRRIYDILLSIPYGRTLTYGEIAAKCGTSARAVGGAVGHNPISLMIPCHRVIGADGSLTGYAGGIERKEWLLALEGIIPAPAGKDI